MNRLPFLFLAIALSISLASCSSSAPEAKQVKQPNPYGPGPAVPISNKNPLAKYMELAGFRLSEEAAGKLNVKFTVINHSDADLGDLVVKVRLVTTASKPEDPPITEFEAKVPSLGPQATEDVSARATTKLRLYELPDWQFLRADFDVVSPAP